MDFTLIAAIDAATIAGWLGTAFIMALGLGFVIFVHELGHFLVAKAVGVKCEKFYIGFDFIDLKLGPITIPRALWKMQWGETEYGIGILPLGGYVKMLGQDDDPRNAAAEAERIRLASESSDAGPFNPDDVRTSELAKGTSEEGLREGHTVERPVKLDPRSYPAKSVPARMAIISAGVIMNLIFAVLMAAVAFKMGVQEIPAIIGGTLPGDPAWQAGLDAGDKIIQIGRNSTPYERMRWTDIMRGVVFNGPDRDMAILVRRPDGEEKWFEIRPSTRLKEITGHPSLGVTSFHSGELAVPPETPDFMSPKTSVPLKNHDRIVAIEGEAIREPADINRILARHFSKPLTITVERQAETKDGEAKPADGKSQQPPQKIDVVVEPRAFRETGIEMKIGPIVALRENSPAVDAGFKEGDVITAVNGEAVGDPISLPQRLASKAGETVEFTVSRKDRDGKPIEKQISVAYTAPDSYFNEYRHGGPVGFTELGIAYDVLNTVASVVPGSPAEKAGIKPGDIVQIAEFKPQGEEATKFWNENLKKALEDPALTLEGPINTWTRIQFISQLVHPSTDLVLTVDRGGKEEIITLTPALSDSFFDESRHLAFYGARMEIKATTWSEALWLGTRETKERVGEVLGVLSRLLTGQISPTNLSGPIGIGTVAWSAAKSGPAVLLMFLTMLSANLAVLNFLPIPALDGGHMLFLAAEGIRGKPVDEQLQVRLTVAGVLCLLSLMVFATMMDFGRFFN